MLNALDTLDYRLYVTFKTNRCHNVIYACLIQLSRPLDMLGLYFI